MKPLSLNISKMKKISTDKHSSTFMHPSGHKIVIAHNGIPAAQRKQLEQLPIQKMADGGDVSINTDNPAIPEYLANPNPGSQADSGAVHQGSLPDPGDLPYGVSADNQSAPDTSAPVAEKSPAPSDDAMRAPSSSAPSSSSSSPVDVNSAYQQGQKAITEQQGVSSNLAKAQAGIQQDDVQARQDLMNQFKKNTSDFQTHQQQFIQDYANNHIDPKHYVENMGTGRKISTAIGLLFGGAGAGAGRPNPGAEFLQKQIDRDISAQESRMNQQKTIIGANRELYGDQLIANNATRVNMNDIYDHQIQLAAAKMGTPQAKAQADAAHSNFAMQNAQLLQQNALRKTVMDQIGRGGSGLSAIDLAHAGMIPEPDAIKEQASIDAQNAGIKQVQDLYSKLGKEQTLGNRISNPIQSGSNIDALNAQITNAVMGADVSHRLTPESAKLEVLPFHVNLKDSPETASNKMMGVLDLIKQHNAGLTPMMNRYSPQSLPKYPTQASAPQTQTMNGVQYVKVPGGWKKAQ